MRRPNPVETDVLRVLSCAGWLAAAGCDLWETECRREPARCAPRPVLVTPTGPFDRTASDDLKLQLDGPLRQTAPLRAQLEDSQGRVLLDLGAGQQAPYPFPLAAAQRRCLPDQVSLRVYQLAKSLTWESLTQPEQTQVTLDVPPVTFTSPLVKAASLSAGFGEQSVNIGGLGIVSDLRMTVHLIQVLWQFADGGTGGLHNRFRAYQYNPLTHVLDEQRATSTPALLDGGYAWANGHGGKGLVVQKAAAGNLVAFSTDSTVDSAHALVTGWTRFNNNPTGLTYHPLPALDPVVVAVDAQRTVALLAAVDVNGQPFVAARLPPFDNTMAASLPASIATLGVLSLTSLGNLSGADPLSRFLVVDTTGILTALSYDPAAKAFAVDTGLTTTLGTVFQSSGVLSIVALAAGNLNGDGLPDLVVAARDGAGLRIHFYQNLSAAGQVLFQTAAANSGGLDLAPLGLSAVTQLALGDVDGDGLADVVLASAVAGGSAPQLALLLQTCPFL